MNSVVLQRRLTYISAMVVLIGPLYFLGRPSVRNMDGTIKNGRTGGALAQIRTKNSLGQGDLGELEPASESMRLATLGLRGVAATILWQKAEYYKKEQYWDRLSATLNQIAALQPHFIEIWKFQSHNMSYNVSTQFDNYEHRYEWVKRGMDYLVRGAKINKTRTEMPFELGWFFGNKMGVADEKVQYRQLYRDDRDFHEEILAKTGLDVTQKDGRGPDQKPDNWLTGRLWYERCYEMVASGAKQAKSTLMFYQKGPQWRMKHAEAIQAESYAHVPAASEEARAEWRFEAASAAWRFAQREWEEFGMLPILTTYGSTIQMGLMEKANEDFQKAQDDFAEFCGGIYDELQVELIDKLEDVEREALDLPYEERNFEQVLLAENAAYKILLNPDAVAKRLEDDEARMTAMTKAKEMVRLREQIRHIDVYRNQINYAYWAERCLAEQEEEALLARTQMFNADQHLENAELTEAFKAFEEAFINWDKLFNKRPAMMIDDIADEVIASVQRYKQILDEPELPEDFPLNDFLEFRRVYEDQFADPAMLGVISSWPKKYPGRNFLTEMLRKSEEYESQFRDTGTKDPAEMAPAFEMIDPESGKPLEKARGPAAEGNDHTSGAEEQPPVSEETKSPAEEKPPAAEPGEQPATDETPAETKESTESRSGAPLSVSKPTAGSAPGPEKK